MCEPALAYCSSHLLPLASRAVACVPCREPKWSDKVAACMVHKREYNAHASSWISRQMAGGCGRAMDIDVHVPREDGWRLRKSGGHRRARAKGRWIEAVEKRWTSGALMVQPSSSI